MRQNIRLTQVLHESKQGIRRVNTST